MSMCGVLKIISDLTKGHGKTPPHDHVEPQGPACDADFRVGAHPPETKTRRHLKTSRAEP